MTAGLEVAIADTFQKALGKLDATSVKHVLDAIGKLQNGHGSVHLHGLETSPHKSFGVNRNALRVICSQEGEQLLLLWVDAHDDAYRWAERHQVRQVGSVIRIVETVEDDSEAVAVTADEAPGPLAYLRAKDLRHLEVDARAARLFTSVRDEDELMELAYQLREPLASALLALGDQRPLDEVVRNYEAAKTEGRRATTLAEALRAPENSQHISILPPGEDALARALSGSLEDWQVFLHPSQRRLVTKDVAGPMRITGGPGTGKTVVCLHRARHLAETVFADDPRPVLLTAFSKPLAKRTRAQLVQLCGVESPLIDRIAVRTVVGVAQDILRTAGRDDVFLARDDTSAAWEEAMQQESLDMPRSFYVEERHEVLARHDAWTETRYLSQSRTGRGAALSRKQRKAVWKVLAAFEAACRRRGGVDRIGVAREAARAIASGEAPAPFAAIVVDEAQDCSPGDLRLFAELTRGEGGARPNALTLAGDGYQRIFERPVPLSHCGIDIRGRSWRLHLNYRTTEPIRREAVALIRSHPPDALHEDEPASGDPRDRSLRGGAAPVHETFASAEAEAGWVADRFEARGDSTWLVLARTNDALDAVEAELTRRKHPVRRLTGDDETMPHPGVALATLHRAKGLEAPNVVIVGAERVPMRKPADVPMDGEAWRQQEMSLMYVGMTRARDWCAVTRVSR